MTRRWSPVTPAKAGVQCFLGSGFLGSGFRRSDEIGYFANVIGGNLQCKENQPAPTGGGNQVGSNKDDQCRRF